MVRWTGEGYEVEADPRHAELVIQQLGVGTMRAMGTPGVEGKDEEDNEVDHALEGEKAIQISGHCCKTELPFGRPA